MYILYRHPETKALTITDTTSTEYSPDEKELTFIGDDDVSICIDQKGADELIRKLFADEKLDLSTFDCILHEWDDDDDDYDEDDDDGDELIIDPNFFLNI